MEFAQRGNEPDLRGIISQLKEDFNRKSSEAENLRGELDDLYSKMDRLNSHNNTLETKNETLLSNNKELQASNMVLKQELNDLNKALEGILLQTKEDVQDLAARARKSGLQLKQEGDDLVEKLEAKYRAITESRGYHANQTPSPQTPRQATTLKPEKIYMPETIKEPAKNRLVGKAADGGQSQGNVKRICEQIQRNSGFLSDHDDDVKARREALFGRQQLRNNHLKSFNETFRIRDDLPAREQPRLERQTRRYRTFDQEVRSTNRKFIPDTTITLAEPEFQQTVACIPVEEPPVIQKEPEIHKEIHEPKVSQAGDNGVTETARSPAPAEPLATAPVTASAPAPAPATSTVPPAKAEQRTGHNNSAEHARPRQQRHQTQPANAKSAKRRTQAKKEKPKMSRFERRFSNFLFF